MCSVAECDSWRRSAPRFKLPEDPERRLEWVQFLFEVNSQRLKESSWTDITICSEHFTEGCLVQLYPSGIFTLRPGAVPSVRIKSESEPAVPSVLKSESEPEPAVSSVLKSESEVPWVLKSESEPAVPSVLKSESEPEPAVSSVLKSESEPAIPSVLKSESEPEPAVSSVLKSESEPGVPSVQIKSELEEHELCQEPVETAEVSSHFNKLEPCDSPSACSDESEPTSVASPVPSDTSDDFMSDFGQILQKVVNIDLIREKAGRLHMKGKYVVNEKRLLQLFHLKCPLCCSNLKMEKFTYGLLIILKQQCLQCEYRNQWKSQINASVPAAVDQNPTGGVDVTPEIQQTLSTDDNNSAVTGVSEMDACIDDESDPMDEDDMDSDEDWTPMDELEQDNDLCNAESDEESDDYDDDDLPVSHRSELCTDCGKFFNKLKPHTCEHIIKPYSCNICGKRCVTEVALNSHSRVHDENYEHRCKYCCVAFKTKMDKIKHEPSHIAEEKPYKCPDCSESFATNKKRRIHQLDHRGPSKARCHICGIDFYQTMKLRRHLVVHTGVKAFKCSVCQRGFNQASHLKSHMRLHTGEKPYKCQHCDKSFNHNVSLKSHVQRYHTNVTVSDTVDAQENRNKKGTQAREKKGRPKHKRKGSGRPIGRPKRNAVGNLVRAEEMRSQCSNAKTAKVKVQASKTRVCRGEEREGELMESDTSFHSAEEEEERSEKIRS